MEYERLKIIIENYLTVNVFSKNIINPKTLIKDISDKFDLNSIKVVDIIMNFEKKIIRDMLNNDKDIINITNKTKDLDYVYHQAFMKNFNLIKTKLKLD